MENLRLQTENCRMQTENDRLHSQNSHFRTENSSPGMEEDVNYYCLQPVNFPFSFDTAFPSEIEKRAEEEVEALWGIKEDAATKDEDEEAVNSKEKKEDDEDEGDRLRSENRRLKVENTRLKEAERATSTVQFQLEIENASLRMEEEVAEKAIREREDMREALELAVAQCESLRLKLDEKKKSDEADEKFAQLVEARIARDKAVEKMEDCMAYNKYLEERFGRHERAVHVVRGQRG